MELTRRPCCVLSTFMKLMIAIGVVLGEVLLGETQPNISLNFNESSVVILDGSDVMSLNAEKSTGFFYIDIKIYSRIRFKIGSIKTRRFKPEIECKLRIPLSSNGTSAGEFQSTQCDVDF
uniref:Uncharacterized protein n=1 Tax=Nelumbo nucifera TaxID=4432 RepID=A0A822YD69_NELNU|nr:TPA_asm: hypothetical protein HUJ06_030393 [Nelumbo nucifera]